MKTNKKDIVYYSAAGIVYFAFLGKLFQLFRRILEIDGWEKRSIASFVITLAFVTIGFILGIKLYQKGDSL